MKYLFLLLVFVFLLFAGWQYNDPDPLLWITVYLIAAYNSLRAFQGKANREALFLLTLWTVAWAFTSWWQMTAWEGFVTEGEGLTMKSMNQELAREACGLGIVAVSYLLILVRPK
ncbi:MAG: transmembrane 220 family protein [Siphonobacter aquaeclarae]|nr:transmembrane 220 family protein [Siphonobacter aquaeclarae]